jgi:hypothetical protein
MERFSFGHQQPGKPGNNRAAQRDGEFSAATIHADDKCSRQWHHLCFAEYANLRLGHDGAAYGRTRPRCFIYWLERRPDGHGQSDLAYFL